MAAKDHGHGRKTHGGADVSCCGVIEESAARSRARREKRMEKPHPWVLLKLTVVVTLGIMGYAAYVYVGRFCIPMIRDNDGAIAGGRKTGSESVRSDISNYGRLNMDDLEVAFVVIFALLGLMMLWTYGMVSCLVVSLILYILRLVQAVFISPGKAKDVSLRVNRRCSCGLLMPAE